METQKQLNGVMNHDLIRENLDQIRDFIELELAEKKETIKNQSREIEELKKTLQQKDTAISMFEANAREFQETAEGNRQLINKLLGDISRLQNDVDWYRRTYETRSFLGTLKQKFSSLFSNKK